MTTTAARPKHRRRLAGESSSSSPEPSRRRRAPSSSPRRTLRPRGRRPPLLDDFADYLVDDDVDEDDHRKHRKLKLILKLNHRPDSSSPPRSRIRVPVSSDLRPEPSPPRESASSSACSLPFGDDWDEDGAVAPVRPPKKRGFEDGGEDGGVSDGSGDGEIGKRNAAKRCKEMNSGNIMMGGTPLPEKRVLEMVLDKIQKKDVYGVFGVPVNPDELPDYHDVIEHPMDFGTMRKKLTRNSYSSFEQFEDDMFLICSNAMQYNAPDTIYFRQACAMQDLGRKEFQRLRAEGKCNGTYPKPDLRSECQEVRSERKCNGTDSLFEMRKREFHSRRDEEKCNGTSTSDFGRSEFQERRGEGQYKGPGSKSDLGRAEFGSKSDLGKAEFQKLKIEGKCNRIDSTSDLRRSDFQKQRGESKHKGIGSKSDLGRAEPQKLINEAKYNRTDSKSELGRIEFQKRRGEGKYNGIGSKLERKEFKKLRDELKQNRTDNTSNLGRTVFKKQTGEGKHYGADPKSNSGRVESEKLRDERKYNGTDSASDLGRTKFQKLRDERKYDGTDSTSDLARTKFQKVRTEGKVKGTDSSSDLGRTQFLKVRTEGKCNRTDPISDRGEREFQKVRAEEKTKPITEGKCNRIDPISDSGGKDFQKVRAEEKSKVTDSISEERIRYTPTEKKSLQKSLPVNTQEPLASDISSAATLTSPGDACSGPKTTQAIASQPPVVANGLTDGNSSLDENKSEKLDEPSVKDSPYKLGKKSVAVDENRRATYNISEESFMVESNSVFVLEGEEEQLFSVGPDEENSYARSLARFAASLGPIGWTIASQRISRALPVGVTFGPGWVGEYEPLHPSVLHLENCLQKQLDADPVIPLGQVLNRNNETKMERKGRETVAPVDARLDLQSQAATRSNNRDSGPLKERIGRERPMEHKMQSAKNSSVAQPRKSIARLELQNEQKSKNFPVANVNSMEQVRVRQQYVSNNISVNRTAHRVDLGPERNTFGSPAMISFDSKFVKPEPVEVQILNREGYGGNAVKSNNSRDQNPNMYGTQINARGFISKEQHGTANFSIPTTSLQQGTNNPLRLMTLTGGTFNLSNAPSKVIDSVNFFPAAEESGRGSANTAASAAARAWMSVGTSSQGKLSVDVAGVCDSQARSSSTYGYWRTANSSPRTLGSPRAALMSPAFRQTNQEGRLEPLTARGVVNFPQSVPLDLGHAPWQGNIPQIQHRSERNMFPPDLNVTLELPGSPVQQHSGIVKDTQQPDLALQL